MRHFTVDEANELVPMLSRVLEDLQRLSGRLREAVKAVHQFERRAIGNGHSPAMPPFDEQQDLNAIQAELGQRLQYLNGIGVHLKDIEHGILDFPTRMQGREVYLCWRLGEERVEYWHDMDAGYAGRRPLP